MNPTGVAARRANVDDLPTLRQLWMNSGFETLPLEKRLTEFQVLQENSGKLLGASGLTISNRQALLRHESFGISPIPASLRLQLLQRQITLARNHGLSCIWVSGGDPFWTENGFTAADESQLKRLPAEFGGSDGGWLKLQLREETEESISVEREFELFQQAQRETSERALKQARMLKSAAVILLGIACVALAYFMLGVFQRSPILFDLMNRR